MLIDVMLAPVAVTMKHAKFIALFARSVLQAMFTGVFLKCGGAAIKRLGNCGQTLTISPMSEIVIFWRDLAYLGKMFTHGTDYTMNDGGLQI